MKKLFLLICTFVICNLVNAQNNTFPSSGNTGIGVTNPQSKLQVSGTRSNIINSANSISQIGGADVFTTFGSLNGTPNYGGWIQVLRPSDDATLFPLLLNPNGGNVGMEMNINF